MKKFAVFALLTVCLGCAAVTGQKIRHMSEGMSKNEVIDLLGAPDGFQRNGEYTALKYLHRYIDGYPGWGGNGDRADYVVILKNDKVAEWGAGEVHINQNQGNGGILFIMPVGLK